MIRHDDTIRFRATDPQGYVVECTDRQWNTHIAPGHDMMIGRENEVIKSIEDPHKIFTSNQSGSARAYFTEASEGYIFTVVETAPYGRMGEVVTSLPKAQVKGGIVPDGLLYERP